MAQQQLADLPSEVRFEIFSFLSVKHVGNLLSLNKSTHDQLINSNTFWRNLLKGSVKGLHQATPNFDDDDIESLKNQLMEMVIVREEERNALKRRNEKLLCEIEDLEEMMEVMQSDHEVLGEFKTKLDEIQEMSNQSQIKLNSLMID